MHQRQTDSREGTVLDLLDRLAHASPPDLAFLKLEAKRVREDLLKLSEPDHLRTQAAGVPKSAYDAWVVELFSATETAVPREALLRDFARRFGQMHAADKNDHQPRILILHYLGPQGGSPHHISGFFQQGLPTNQWKQFQEYLEQHQDDPALLHLFSARNRFEKDYLPYMQQGGYYRGVFDAALYKPKGATRDDWARYGPNVWISAQALFGEDAREGHAVVMLYPSEGRYFEYREPVRSGQDLRLLDVLAAVYRQLDNQIKNLAVEILRAREQFFAKLGPSVIHHEVGGLARQALGVLNGVLEDWQDFEVQFNPPPVVARLGQSLSHARDWVDKIEVTTQAFMNLERRGQVAPFPVATVLAQVQRMVIVRCGQIGARLDVQAVLDQPDSDTTPRELRNDATLVMHALLNLINNALDAMEARYLDWQRALQRADELGEPGPTPYRSVVSIRWARQALPPWCVGWEVVNTGPPIPLQVQSRIFERGFTTRREGHGQGLHLVRMSAQYCGGGVALIPEAALNAHEREAVGFVYWVARNLHVTQELSI